jgi:acylphosphatase
MSASEMIRLHVWVKGRVQGVGFRAFVAAQGRRLNLLGWVRNVGPDTVEAVIEGARPVAERLAAIMKEGPPGSHVDQDRVEEEAASGEFSGFEIRRSH